MVPSKSMNRGMEMTKDKTIEECLIIDGHSDIPRHLYLKYQEGIKNSFHEDHYLPLKKGQVNIVVVNIFTKESNKSPLNQGMMQIHLVNEVLKNNKDVVLILEVEDLKNVIASKKIGLILSMEGFEPLEGEVDLLHIFYKLGVRAGMLTWNSKNDFASGPDTKEALSEKGIKVIQLMNALNMLVDVSHLNEEGFWQVISISDGPVIASHSNARELFNHPRNLSDDQMKAIAKTGGIIGVVPYFSKVDFSEPSKPRLNDDNSETIEDYIKHIEYIVDLVGYDHVAFGFDFNIYLGDFGVKGIEDTEKITNVITLLLQRGHAIGDIEKITGKNLLRVFNTVLE